MTTLCANILVNAYDEHKGDYELTWDNLHPSEFVSLIHLIEAIRENINVTSMVITVTWPEA